MIDDDASGGVGVSHQSTIGAIGVCAWSLMNWHLALLSSRQLCALERRVCVSEREQLCL